MSKDPKELLEFVKANSLVEVVLYYWLGRRPEDSEARILEEIMILAIDHGPESPSARATIAAANGNQDVIRSVESGVYEINDSHGGAVEGLGRILQEDPGSAASIVEAALRENRRLPGFGHRLYKTQDPRAVYMLDRLKELNLYRDMAKKAVAIETELEKQKGKKLVMNIDGGMAVVLSEIGVKPELMNAFFLWPRVAGLVYQWQKVAEHR